MLTRAELLKSNQEYCIQEGTKHIPEKQKWREWESYCKNHITGASKVRVIIYAIKVMMRLQKDNKPLEKAEEKFNEKKNKLKKDEISFLLSTVARFHPKGTEFKQRVENK